MDLILISTFFAPNIVGGTESLNFNLVKIAIQHGLRVKVVSFDTPHTKTEILDGIDIYRFYIPELSESLMKVAEIRKPVPKKTLLKFLFSPLFRSSFSKEIKQLVSSLPPSKVIHFSGSFSQFPLDILLKSFREKYSDSRFIASFHDHSLLGRMTVPPHKKVLLLALFKKAALKKYVDLYVAPSRYILNKVKDDLQLPDNKLFLLYNSLSPGFTLKENGNLPGKAPSILYAGGFEYGKGVDTLCSAFLELRKTHPTLKLTLVGEGSDKEKYLSILSQAPPDSYEVLGKLPQEQLFMLFNTANFVILPSRYNEIFGMILVEGYYSGALPLGSNKGAIPEVLSYDADLLFDSRQDLQTKLNNLLNNPDFFLNKRKALKKGMEQFSSSYFVSSLIKLYN
jgi:glycosyltransferase involved in cell wall biosynthesis